MVDQYTKWVECMALPSQTAQVTAKAAVDHFFKRFRYSIKIFTDHGVNFQSELFKALCDFTDSSRQDHAVSTIWKTLMDAIRCYVDKSPRTWDQHLSVVARALQSCVNRATGPTPNHLLLGREVLQPLDLMFPLPKGDGKPRSELKYLLDLQEAMVKANALARSLLRTYQKRLKRDYDLRVRLRSFTAGQMVYIFNSTAVNGVSKRLVKPLKGPGVSHQRYLENNTWVDGAEVDNCPAKETKKEIRHFTSNGAIINLRPRPPIHCFV